MFNSLKNTLRGLQRATGIDFHVAATLLLRGWGLAAGGVMILIISATLTPQQQGFYFTFSSLLGLQIFFELGLNQVVIQLVSHESAHISRDALGCPNGDFAHLDRLASIVRLLRRWYLAAAIAFCAVTTAVGILLFHRAENIAMSNWLGPWVLLVIVTALNLYLSPMLAVIEGCGWVGLFVGDDGQ